MKSRNAAAAVLVLAAIALVTVVASTAFGDGRSGHSPLAGCSNFGWAATAEGRPATLVSATARSVFVWRDARAWHLWTRGGSRSSPLIGEVHTNALLRVVNASTAMRSGLKAQARSLSVRVASGELATLDFASSCASRLSFRFGGTHPAPATFGASIAQTTQGSTPRVYLGAAGTAPAKTFRLQKPATTGVAGRILIGPTCPVARPDCPPAKPAEGTVRIETAPAGRESTGHVVARVKSDVNGNYSTDLAPGRYVLVVEKLGGGYPTPRPSAANIETGVVTLVDLYLDSGIR